MIHSTLSSEVESSKDSNAGPSRIFIKTVALCCVILPFFSLFPFLLILQASQCKADQFLFSQELQSVIVDAL